VFGEREGLMDRPKLQDATMKEEYIQDLEHYCDYLEQKLFETSEYFMAHPELMGKS
jgi:hypothetical protein